MSIWHTIKGWMGLGADPDSQAVPHKDTPATAASWRQWHSPQPSPALRRVALIGPAHGHISGDAQALAQALAQLGLEVAQAAAPQTLLAQVVTTPLEWRFVLVDCAPGPLPPPQTQALAAFHASCPSVPLIALAEAHTAAHLRAPGGLPWARVLEKPLSPDTALQGLGALGTQNSRAKGGENQPPQNGPWQLN